MTDSPLRTAAAGPGEGRLDGPHRVLDGWPSERLRLPARHRAVAARRRTGQPRCGPPRSSSQRTKTGLTNWEGEAFAWSPDVVVLNYGHFETVHLFLPQRLERHANSLGDPPGADPFPVPGSAEQGVARHSRACSSRLDRRLPSTMFWSRPRRVTADLVQLVERLQLVGSPLVFLMELTPPGPPYAKWFPGMAERIAVMNEALADVVRRVDMPNVRHFRDERRRWRSVAAGRGGQPGRRALLAARPPVDRRVRRWRRSWTGPGTSPTSGPRRPPVRDRRGPRSSTA